MFGYVVMFVSLDLIVEFLFLGVEGCLLCFGFCYCGLDSYPRLV